MFFGRGSGKMGIKELIPTYVIRDPLRDAHYGWIYAHR